MSGLGWLLSTVSGVAAPLVEAVRSAASSPSDRRVWAEEGHVHLEARGIHLAGTEEAAGELTRRLNRLDGVHGAEVNSVLGRVVVRRDPARVSESELAGTIAELERDHGLDEEAAAPASAHHPGNADAVLRDAGALATSLLGVGYSVAGALLPVRGISPLVPAVVSLVDSVPWLRTHAVARLGETTASTTLALGGAVSQSLTRSPLAVFTDACNRFCSARETIARNQGWRRWERTTDLQAHRSEIPQAAEPRPCPLPEGPVERVANVSGGMALAGYAAVLAATRAPQRALAALQAGIPRPAHAGREAFASQLTASLSDRGCLLFDRKALRRLDRVDTVVFDESALITGRKTIDSVLPADPEADPAPFFEHASELVDPHDPTARRKRAGWAVTPLGGTGKLPEHLQRATEIEAGRGATMLVLSQESEPVALVVVVDQLRPLAEALLGVAGTAGEVAVAQSETQLSRRLDVDRLVAGGELLARSVRELQADGRVVAVVSCADASALTAADVGIGLSEPERTPPWGADVICPNEAQIHTLLLAVGNARSASWYAAALSVAGSCVAAAWSSLGPATGAPGRASMPVHLATLGALAMGTWSGLRAGGAPPPLPQERTPWHALPVSAVLRALSTSPSGLTESAAGKRERPAEARQARVGLAGRTAEALATPITPVLAVGAITSASLGSVVDAALIGGVLLASALVEGIQRVATDHELNRLLDTSQVPARLVREGRAQDVPADELVVGDIVELHAGDAVPADCRIVEAEGLEADESSLTGESTLVTKSIQATSAGVVADRTCMLYQGTAVASGTATAVVVATGLRTELGRTTQENGDTSGGTGGVEARLGELTRQILPISVLAGGGLMVLDLLRGVPWGGTIGRSVGLAVAAVPEGLPFVATLAELAAARRLSRQGVLVRSPATIEALGRVNVLCFDKTGTLTRGRITLRRVTDGTTSAPLEEQAPWRQRIVAAAVAASPQPNGDRPLAHPTDRAVLDGAREAGIEPDERTEVVADLPFEPSRSYHAVRSIGPEGAMIHVKGAPEVVLDRCARWRRSDGDVPFDAEARARVEEQVERWALQGYRLLAVAERTSGTGTELEDSDVDDLNFLGLVGMADPVHPTAAESVARLQNSGIDVVMITGDHPSTAEAIAAELGMLGDKRVMHGAELSELDDEQLRGELPKISVFARVSPSQKARIVRQLRAADRIVAMTGDGANDVPAIKLSHVGIALGSHATPAARESADLVVSDDRIETLTSAIVEGRGMWASVRDALAILLGGNLGEIGFSLGAGLLGSGAALNTRQLLVVNMLTDVLPATAIAVRPPPHATPERLLTEGPEVSLGSALTRDVYTRATVTACSAGAAWLLARPLSTAGQARTTGLVALVSAQLAQTLAIRGRTPLVLAAAVVSLAALAALVQIPGVSHFFGSQPLLPHQWAIALGSAAAAAAAVAVWNSWPSPSVRGA